MLILYQYISPCGTNLNLSCELFCETKKKILNQVDLNLQNIFKNTFEMHKTFNFDSILPKFRFFNIIISFPKKKEILILLVVFSFFMKSSLKNT